METKSGVHVPILGLLSLPAHFLGSYDLGSSCLAGHSISVDFVCFSASTPHSAWETSGQVWDFKICLQIFFPLVEPNFPPLEYGLYFTICF